MRKFNHRYQNDFLNHVAFPLGGLGAGMFCIDGNGGFSHFSVKNKPDCNNEPCLFSALTIFGKKNMCRLLQGPVPSIKIFSGSAAADGLGGTLYGFPRYSKVSFAVRFPFGMVELNDKSMPIQVSVTAWSPFIPSDEDNSSLPVVAVEYGLRNQSAQNVEGLFSFHSGHILKEKSGEDIVLTYPQGVIIQHRDQTQSGLSHGEFLVQIPDENVVTNYSWFRGGWFDPLTMVWRDIEKGKIENTSPPQHGNPSPGASLGVKFRLKARQEKKIKVLFCWYWPTSQHRIGPKEEDKISCRDHCQCGDSETETNNKTYQPWYSSRFSKIEEVAQYWKENYNRLKDKTLTFSECFYSSTLPPEVVEAVAANLSILKSPTLLRQQDGRVWGWEGCQDESGCCPGSCTHVWNYGQALAHLFPRLERGLRETEFFENQDEKGHQNFRAALPIRPTDHQFHAAADGQLGGVIKTYREWRISGDTDWLKRLWPHLKASLDYCIESWDPRHQGWLAEPHHNTYDIEFWGPDSLCNTLYLGALKAAEEMGRILNAETDSYRTLFEKGKRFLEEKLFNGEYFYQRVTWEGLRAGDPTQVQSLFGEYSPEALELLKKEGPRYQYGHGCLSDGIFGIWLACVCKLGDFIDQPKIKAHLKSVFKYNFKRDLSLHANSQRPGYALGREGGLLLCTWPKGQKPSLPFVYSNEVWTGIEYQVASHLMMMGMVKEGLEIVRTVRRRYDGKVRNPFDEYECGHWYARALSSYGLLQGLTGICYDAVEKILYIRPAIKRDFKCFFSTANGFGIAGIKKGKPWAEIRMGSIEIKSIQINDRKYRNTIEKNKNIE